MTTKIIKKRFKNEPNNYLLLRHELFERKFSFREAIIIEFMFNKRNSSDLFNYPIAAIQQATGISRPIIYSSIKKFMKKGFLEREDFIFRFTAIFREFHEEICDNVRLQNKTYSTIVFAFKEKYSLSILEYCVLDSFRIMTAGGYLKCSPLYIAGKYNITERYYYQIRKSLQEKGLIEIENLNFLKLTPDIKQDMENFFK